VICLLNFLTQVELGINYPPRHVRRKPAVMGEAEKLCVPVRGDDDDAVKLVRGTRLVEQGNIHQQPCSAEPCLAGEGGPADADGGMKYLFKDFSPFVVAEDKVAEFCPVRSSELIARFEAEGTHDRTLDFLVRREEFMHAAVGVKVLHRQLRKQMPGERRLSGGDAAGEAKDGHGL